MGSTSLVDNCEPTITLLQQTWPSQAGYCMTAALASENPGYEQTYIYAVRPPPPPPLENVIVTIGAGAC